MRPLLRTATALCLALASCGAPSEKAMGPDYIETGDLQALARRGRLRILMPPAEASGFPRRGYAIGHEGRLARMLAEELGLEFQRVIVPERDRLLAALLEGRGDIVLARLAVTPEREKRYLFTVPLDYTREVLAVRARNETIRSPEDLEGVEVAVRASSSFHETLLALQGKIPLKVRTVPEHVDTEQVLAGVADGTYACAAADEDLLNTVLEYRDDLKQAFALTDARPIAWAMRPDNLELKAAVDRFLHEQALTARERERHRGDLEEIRRRKVLRVLTRNNAITTYLHRGKQMGFEFELARRFARSLGCRIELLIPPDFSDLVEWLEEGRGDLIAAAMTVTPERARRVAFTVPYRTTRQVVVSRVSEEAPARPEDLAGRVLTVRASSGYHSTLRRLQEEGIDLLIEEAPESVETEDLIAGVGEGSHDLTVADREILDIEASWRDDIRPAFEIGEPDRIAWAVRPDNPALLQAANGFLRKHTRGSAFFNILRERYLTDHRRISRRVMERPKVSGRISPWDDLFKKHGAEAGIDWRLLAAQAYQESRFDPRARSWSGAFGLMQLMPRTLNEIGIKGDLRDPGFSIRAGALYMKRLMDEYSPRVPLAERLLFALGSYNVGPGHVEDARRLARREGLDPDRWFGQVEKALPLLRLPAYAQRARYGYCQCTEPVRYVREIQARYARYVQDIPLPAAAGTEPSAAGIR